MSRAALVLWLVAAALPASAETSWPGPWLLMVIPDARTVALGHTGVALDDLDANTYYNPASIVSGPHTAASWTHMALEYGISYDHAGIAYRQGERLGLAASVAYMQFGVFEALDEYGHLLGRYRNYDLAPGVSAAYRVLPSLTAGMTFKGIYSRIWKIWPELGINGDWQAFTVAVDAGAQYRPLNSLTLGFAVNDLGPNLRYDSSSADILPRVARLGFALRPTVPGPVSALLTGDVSRDLFPSTAKFAWHYSSGLEVGFWNVAFVRLGYFRNNHVEKGFTWGVGLSYHGISLDAGADSEVYGPGRVRFQLSARL